MNQSPELVALRIGEATITIPAEVLVHNYLATMLKPASSPTEQPAALAAPLRIGSDSEHGKYVGIMAGADGASDYHLFLVDGQATDVSWDQAVAWAEKLGASLPTRREQRLLFANAAGDFDKEYYWSGEQCAPLPSYAWYQNFSYGGQYHDHKSNELRARAVRRLEI